MRGKSTLGRQYPGRLQVERTVEQGKTAMNGNLLNEESICGIRFVCGEKQASPLLVEVWSFLKPRIEFDGKQLRFQSYSAVAREHA